MESELISECFLEPYINPDLFEKQYTCMQNNNIQRKKKKYFFFVCVFFPFGGRGLTYIHRFQNAFK